MNPTCNVTVFISQWKWCESGFATSRFLRFAISGRFDDLFRRICKDRLEPILTHHIVRSWNFDPDLERHDMIVSPAVLDYIINDCWSRLSIELYAIIPNNMDQTHVVERASMRTSTRHLVDLDCLDRFSWWRSLRVHMLCTSVYIPQVHYHTLVKQMPIWESASSVGCSGSCTLSYNQSYPLLLDQTHVME